MSMMRNKGFKRVLILSVFIVAFFAFMDLLGFQMFDLVGGFSSDTYIKLMPGYMTLFWSFALGVVLFVAATYYLLTKDKSETLAIIAVPTILTLFGLEDVLYYLFGGFEFVGATMPWLNNNIFISTISSIMGSDVVTSTTLMVSVVIGGLLAYGAAVWLKKL